MTQPKLVGWMQNAIPTVTKICWVLFLVSLPVTSFPYFPAGLGGGTLVRPLAIYPLLLLIVLVTLPRLFTQTLPRTIVSFFPFCVVALVSVLLASLMGIEPAQGVSVSARMLRALLTLGLGAAIYFTVSLWPRTSQDLDFSLRWLYAGFGIALLWGSLQVFYILHYSDDYFNLINQLQKYVSIRRLFPTRVSGLTYEPNWFAEQIGFLLLPFLFASVSRGYSVFNWRLRWITVEWLLLGWATIVMIFTFSRTGIAIALTLLFLSVILFIPFRNIEDKDKQPKYWHLILKRLVIAGLVIMISVAGIFIVGLRSNYFSRIWRYWTEDTKTSSYLEYIAFSQRFIYWQTAYNIYLDHPIFGVGAGNYAYFFEEHLPDQPYNTTPEILTIITQSQRAGRLITSKSLFARLIAETGLFGVATFLAFIMAVFGNGLYLWLSHNREQKYFGAAALLGMVAFFITTLSTDSFAIPNMWVVFGVATAAVQVSLFPRMT